MRICRAVRPRGDVRVYHGLADTGEVLPLEWRQVDQGAGEVRLDPGTTKNGPGACFPFTDELRAAVRGLVDAEREALQEGGHDHPYVFHRHGKRIKSLRGAWESACDGGGMSGTHPARPPALGGAEHGAQRPVAVRSRCS